MGRPLSEDLTGQRFGRLVVLRRAGSRTRQPLWECRCDCGTVLERLGNGLRRGTVNSCGCLVAETNKALRQTHGRTDTRIYRIWNAMKQRCHNPNQAHYGRYGGRGVQVCQRWRDSFDAFFEDMGEPPTEKHSLDRIDNDGNYEPGNVRWATASEQQNNKRETKLRGEAHGASVLTENDVRAIRLSSLGNAQLARAYGVNVRTIWSIRTRRTWGHVP